MAIKTKYRIKNDVGKYEIVHFQTSADQVVTTEERQFISAEEKKEIAKPKHYVHSQLSASSTWNINHNLNKYPSVSIADSAGTLVIGEVRYVDSNNVTISFNNEFAGIAYLN